MSSASNNYKKMPLSLFLFFLGLIFYSPQIASAETNSNKMYTIGILSSNNIWGADLLQDFLSESFERYNQELTVVFPKEMPISVGFNDGKNHEADYAKAARSLMQNEEISLILAIGPYATNALLKENNKTTPVVSTLTPGINDMSFINLKTKLSKHENFTFTYDQNLWVNAFSLFHSSIAFKKMGIIYPPIYGGKAISAIYELQEVARDFSFDLIEYESASPNPNPKECQDAVKELINQGIDAIYLSPLVCFDFINPAAEAEKLLDILHKNQVRTFSGPAGLQVADGALMGVYIVTPDNFAEFLLAHIFKALQIPFSPVLGSEDKNSLLRFVDQKEHSKLRIGFNLRTARMIGVKIPIELLIVADGIFDKDLEPVKPINDL